MQIRIKLAVLLSMLSVLSGCYDRVEYVVMLQSNGEDIRCPEHDKTTWLFTAPVMVDDEVVYVENDYGDLESSGGHVMGQMLYGSLIVGRHPWVQFNVFCGESMRAYIATKQLTLEDLSENQAGGYTYYYTPED